MSNPPSEVPDDRSDAGDAYVLIQCDSGSHLSRLRRPSTPQAASPPQGAASDDADMRALVRTQQETINLLVAEKSSLVAAVDRLHGIEKSVFGYCKAWHGMLT